MDRTVASALKHIVFSYATELAPSLARSNPQGQRLPPSKACRNIGTSRYFGLNRLVIPADSALALA